MRKCKFGRVGSHTTVEIITAMLVVCFMVTFWIFKWVYKKSPLLTLEANLCKVLETFIPDRVISLSPASDFLFKGLMACKIIERLDSDKGEK